MGGCMNSSLLLPTAEGRGSLNITRTNTDEDPFCEPQQPRPLGLPEGSLFTWEPGCPG